MTNDRAGKDTSAAWWPVGSQENVLRGLDIDMTLELKFDMASRQGE